MLAFHSDEACKAATVCELRSLIRDTVGRGDCAAFRSGLAAWLLTTRSVVDNHWRGLPLFVTNVLVELADLLPDQEAAPGVLTCVRAIRPGVCLKHVQPELIVWLLSNKRHGLAGWFVDRHDSTDEWRRKAQAFLRAAATQFSDPDADRSTLKPLDKIYKMLLGSLKDPHFGEDGEAALSTAWHVLQQLLPHQPAADLWLAAVRASAIRRGTWNRMIYAVHRQFLLCLKAAT